MRPRGTGSRFTQQQVAQSEPFTTINVAFESLYQFTLLLNARGYFREVGFVRILKLRLDADQLRPEHLALMAFTVRNHCVDYRLNLGGAHRLTFCGKLLSLWPVSSIQQAHAHRESVRANTDSR